MSDSHSVRQYQQVRLQYLTIAVISTAHRSSYIASHRAGNGRQLRKGALFVTGLTEPESRVRCCIILLQAAMPRATSDRFSRAHQPSAKPKATKSHGEPSSSSVRNPIFNTERFGQHILKNPSIAQEYAAFSSCDYGSRLKHPLEL
jgi:hypothetical protein